MIFFVATLAGSAMVKSAAGEWKACDEQTRFNIFMCKSHACTNCTLAYCMESCQEIQQDFPTCRCQDWPDARRSYSGGKFASKGKFGDAGDYAKAASAFLSMEIKAED